MFGLNNLVAYEQSMGRLTEELVLMQMQLIVRT